VFVTGSMCGRVYICLSKWAPAFADEGLCLYHSHGACLAWVSGLAHFIVAVAIHHVLLGNAAVCRAQSVGTVPIDDSQVEGENDMEIISPVVLYKHQLPCHVRAADSTL